MTYFLTSDSVRFRDTKIGGVPIRNTTTRALIRFLDRRMSGNAQLAIGFVNQNFILSCRELRSLAEADSSGILLINDGIGVGLASLLITGHRFAENLNGTDFVPSFLRQSKIDLDIFLIGCTPDIVTKACSTFNAMPNRRVVGAIDGFSIWENEAKTIAAINAAKPDILLVGLGNPKQERWILNHRRELDVKVIFAVGALFEWITCARRRAPLILRQAGFEWLYRLVQEPRRLFQRYTINIVRFSSLFGLSTAGSQDCIDGLGLTDRESGGFCRVNNRPALRRSRRGEPSYHHRKFSGEF